MHYQPHIASSRHRVILCLVLVLGLLGSTGYAQTRFIHVDVDATMGAGTGIDFPNAYTNLSVGLRDAYTWITSAPGLTSIVVVAEGTYSPSEVPAWAFPGGGFDRQWSFGLYSRVEMYGGFDATEDPTDPLFDFVNGRKGLALNTILSGDIGLLDALSDNVYSVVTIGAFGIPTDSQRLDGFRIKLGLADDQIGGAFRYGGGINAQEASGLVIENCTLESNSARHGGGFSIRGGSFRMKYCSFTGNFARFDGGGIYARGLGAGLGIGGASNAHNVTLVSNSVGVVTLMGENDVLSWRGGAIYTEDIQERLSFHNCLAYLNFGGVGAAVYLGQNAIAGTDPGTTWTNSTFTQNNAWTRCKVPIGGGPLDCDIEGEGSGFYVLDGGSTHEIENVIIWGNLSGPNFPEELAVGPAGSDPLVDYSDVFTLRFGGGVWPDPGGGNPTNINVDPLFVSWSTQDFHILTRSAARDTGLNSYVPPDVTDLDDDGDFVEQAPWSVERNIRRIYGLRLGSLIVDMGAYEFQTFFRRW